jgi:diguanylate cyclase (GGDEF)-like protein
MAETLRRQATVDILTGLYNVRHFKTNFPAMLEDARATGQPLSLLNIDVNDLKPVNDSYGHDAGDAVLKAIGAHLQRWGRGRIVCWRTGGDEFAAALPGVDATGAQAEMVALERAITAETLTIGGATVPLSVSIGLAAFPEDTDAMGSLIAIADRRMYAAKARAKGIDISDAA